MGLVSGGPRESPILARTPEASCLEALNVRRSTNLGRMSKETRFAYMVNTRFMQLQH